MSLFQLQEWYSGVHPNAAALCVAELIDGRDQIVVGTLDGLLTVLDPGREPEHRQELGGLAELQLGRPVLQLAVGYFLPATFAEQPILAVLLLNALVYFRLVQTAESFVCEQVFEHRVPGPPAFNMCQGHFGRSSVEQVCVQSLQGHLLLFEAENRILQRPLADTLHPGPVGYSAVSESILVASDGFLRSVRHASLIATGTKQVNVDWQLPLGDSSLQLVVIQGNHGAGMASSSTTSSGATRPNSSVIGGGSAVQPSVLVLCKRQLLCCTHGGALRFCIRLQTVALCMRVLRPQGSTATDARIQLVISTGGKTLLFFSDTRLIWSVQVPFAVQLVDTCTFSESLRSLLALLSAEESGRLLVGYLGTEPSLFRMPATEARFIDFEERRQQLRQFEEAIWRTEREKPDAKGQQPQSGLQVSAVSLDARSVAFHAANGVPSATVSVDLLQEAVSSAMGGDLVLACDSGLLSPSGSLFRLEPGTTNFAFTLFPNEQMVLDRRCQLLLISNALHFASFSVPLSLLCREVPAQRQSVAFKLSLDSTRSALGLAQLFPEFTGQGQGEQMAATSMGLQPFFGPPSALVSIFVSTKTNRYRIQSDSADFLYTVFTELVERVQRTQPEARLHCPVPMHLFLTEIGAHIEAEQKQAQLEREAARLTVQMRHVETVFLGKLKANDRELIGASGHQQPTNSLNALVNYAYRELTSILEQINALGQGQLGLTKRRSLRSLLNLVAAILEMNQIHLPFDGRILDGTDQNLSERIGQMLCPSGEQLSTELSAADVGRLLANFCEQPGDKLGGIVEEEEEEEEEGEIGQEEGGTTSERREAKEQQALDEHISKAEAFLEFAQLQSGSVATGGNVGD